MLDLTIRSRRRPSPETKCCACDGFGEDRAGAECSACEGAGYVERDAHGPACDCIDCAYGYWVVADDGQVPSTGEHVEDECLRGAIVRCVELATLTGRPYAVRRAPMWSAPENGERAYEWNDRQGIEFEHAGNATLTWSGDHHGEE